MWNRFSPLFSPIACAVLGVVYVWYWGAGTFPPAENCLSAQQEAELLSFIHDFWMLALIGGLFASGIYFSFLRLQVFFGSNWLRLLISVSLAWGLVVLLVYANRARGSTCLVTALGPNSQVDDPGSFVLIAGRYLKDVVPAANIDALGIVLLFVLVSWRVRLLFLTGRISFSGGRD